MTFERALGLTICLTLPALLGCPSGTVDDDTGFTFTTNPTTFTGDGDGDMMETGTAEAGDGDPGDGDPISESCGDGVVDEGEECDLGDMNSDTGQCTTNCFIASCGDGLVYEGFEECDDGNDDETDGCTSECTPGICGDGVIQSGEQCDDGNQDTSDDCPACQLAFCGDGYVQAGIEICDDGNLDNDDACISPTCVPAECGDGHVWSGMETCDDGNVDENDACPACEPAFCGDGFRWDGMEECDDGNNVDNDGCTNSCISNGATCNDIVYNQNVWGMASNGVDLRSYTDSTLHYIGCPGNGCATNTFYCTYDANAGTLQFGTTSSGALRSAVDPNDQSGDTMPNSFSGCCSQANGLCNAPDSNNNGVNVTMVQALCAALGYGSGQIVREVNSNSCPEPHALSADGLQWTSDWVSSSGFGAEYLCSN